MKYRILFGILLFNIYLPFRAQPGTEMEFVKICLQNSLAFSPPDSFIYTPPIQNPDLYYQYALKHQTRDFEIRFSVWPLKEFIKEYEKSLNDPGITLLNPNTYHKNSAIATLLNISQIDPNSGMLPELVPFPKNAVKQEFNADFGASVFLPVNSEFSKGYQFALFMVLHKENQADLFIIFLGNKKEDFDQLLLKGFYALKFAP
mgnify:FL=1|jgi:hypothetical protein